MSETPPVNDHFEQDDMPTPAPAAPQPARKPGMMSDPLVRRMAYASVGLVVLFLVTVLSLLVTGVMAPTGPRTIAEKEIAVGRAAVSQGTTDTAVWGGYIAALVNSGDYSSAKRVISDGRATLSESSTAEFTLAEARLLNAQKDYNGAIEAADKVMELLDADLEARLAAGGNIKKRAEISGHHENYYLAILIKAYAHQSLGEWEKAIEQFDIYIEREKGAADILVDRGKAKIEAGDLEGAEEDFRTALKFIPDSKDALAGLDKIGVDR